MNNIEKISNYRAGYVAIIGEPNVGKSTLMNSLIGKKISIVTRKPQTTRHKILGILTKDDYQIIFLDTPGLLKPHYLLHKAMMEFALSAINDADLILFMTDITCLEEDSEDKHSIIINTLSKIKKPMFLIINKIDLIKKGEILSNIISHYKGLYFKETFSISALNLTGTAELLEAIKNELPIHPAYYPDDVISAHNERFFVSEIIREKIFEKFRDEIPYSITVDILDFREQIGKKDFISAEIFVERDSQKGIIIGKQGQALKEIGKSARTDIEAFLGRPVFLELHVKVKEKWRDKEIWLKKFGYSRKSI